MVKYLLFGKFGPEVGKPEDLFEEDVVLGAVARPLIELVEHVHVMCEVTYGLHCENCSSDSIHTSAPILICRVVIWSLPECH